MIEVRQTLVFSRWLKELRDENAKARIAIRIRRLSLGNAGDAKSVGGGLRELRVDYGPGYRVYFTEQGRTIVVLLCGGDKRTQVRDIERARMLLRELRNG